MLNNKFTKRLLLCSIITGLFVGMCEAATFDPPPYNRPVRYKAEVRENLPIGTEVIRIGVNNPEGSSLYFRFYVGFYFFDHEYNGSELIIKTNMVLDYEYLINSLSDIDLTVDGFDTYIGVWSDPHQSEDDSIVISIDVLNDPSDDTDPLNNHPEFNDGEEITITVPQNTPAGENIGSALLATDDDSDELSYKLYSNFLTSSFDSQFTIDSTTAQLQTVKSLDEAGSGRLYLYVVDGKGGFDLFYANIIIEPVIVQEVETNENEVTNVNERTTNENEQNNNSERSTENQQSQETKNY
ncbi:cadherin repeat domain-containing protein [Candidatus Poribacteria bacterium]|nr:cadherin repeat domain-containing protein [Candidatus Poribacteria bacterium]